MYAIVDIETTGGFAGNNSITEVAIVLHDGKEITGRYETLVRPGQQIPRYITGLTGITNEMVSQAPSFSEVAPRIHQLLQNRIFIAHNVQFDYSFIKHALELEGFEFRAKKLCTVRLSRQAFPGLRSYGLGNLCESLRIPIRNRHRAMGDADATAVLFDRIHGQQPELVRQMLKHNSRENILPPHLPKEEFEELPEAPGVYYFVDGTGQIIYVGKAINIRKRILGHFGGTAKGSRNQYMRNEVHHIRYELTGNELVALVLESLEIKRLWPKYNQAQKRPVQQFGIYRYEDRDGLTRLQIGKQYRGMDTLMRFHTHAGAWQFLLTQVKTYRLCPKLSGIQKSHGACYDYPAGCLGACVMEEPAEVYNNRVREAIAEFTRQDDSYLIIGEGREYHEHAVILVDHGAFCGFGFCDKSLHLDSPEDAYEVINRFQTTSEIDQYIQTFRNHQDLEVIPFGSATA